MKNLIKREQSKQVCFAESENSRTKFKRFISILMAMMGVLTISAQSIYDFKALVSHFNGTLMIYIRK